MLVEDAGSAVSAPADAVTTAPINLVHAPSRNYAGVQEQILGAITRHLGPEQFSTSVGATVPGSLNFSLFILQPTDVLMSHGLADKNYFWRRDADGEHISPQLSHLLVPGEWMKRRILAAEHWDIDPGQVHVVGWPRLDLLLAAQQQLPVVPPPTGARPKVLWAPTHDYARRGKKNESNSSYPELLEFVPMFEKHFDFSMSLHPRNRTNKQPTHDFLLDCDVVISDFGTIVYEAWALGKPVIFPHWLIGKRIKKHLGGSAEALIFQEKLGLHAKSPKQMVDFVMDGARIDARTQAFLDDYLEPSLAGRSGEHVAGLLQSLSAA